MRSSIAGVIAGVVILAMIIFGCDTAVDDSGPEWWAEAELTRNGDPWPAVPIAMEILRRSRSEAAIDSFYFRLVTFHEDGFQLEHIGFGELPKQAEIHHLRRWATADRFPRALYTALNGGDGITDVYHSNMDIENWLAIDRFDSTSGELDGRVKLTLLPELRTSPGAPDTLRIEGHFSTVVVSDWPECPECSVQE